MAEVSCILRVVSVLALDTATPYLVLGLPHAERVLRLERRHAELLWPELEDFLKSAHTSLESLTGIAVGRGPGSYTGLRVGIAAGLGLGRGLGIPVVGVDTLEAVAMRYKGQVTVAHTTRNGLCYTASYDCASAHRTVLQAPVRIKMDELKIESTYTLDEPPSGIALAQLGQESLKQGNHGIEALYL